MSEKGNNNMKVLKFRTNYQEDRIKELEKDRIKRAEAIANLEGQMSLLIRIIIGVLIALVVDIIFTYYRGG